MSEQEGLRIDEFRSHKSVAVRALSELITGETKVLRVFSDEFMQNNLSADDYVLWLSEKAKHGIAPVSYTHLDVYKRQLFTP